MLLPELRLEERQAPHAPCPGGNGTTIGDEQDFVVFCNTRFRGDEVFRRKSDSLTTCVNICTSFQNPRCEGAQLKNNGDCVLIGNLVPEGTRPSRFFDSAAAVFPQPGPTSLCSQQGSGTVYLSQNSSFTLQCDMIMNGRDLEQQFHMTLEACLASCSANQACGGVTFDPNQSAGFKNCYLKTTFAASELVGKSGLDSAILMNNIDIVGNSNIGAGENTSPPGVAISEDTVPATINPNTDTTPGSVVTVSVPVPATSTSSTGALADSTPEAPARVGNGQSAMGNNGGPRFGNFGSSPSSNAWIAAPIIGGIAALTLILAVFVIWGRRRRRDNSSPGRKSAGPMSRVALGHFGRGFGDAASRMSRGRLFGTEKTRLGDSDGDDDSRFGNSRSGFKVVSGSGRRLGLDGQDLGTGPGLGGMIVTTGGGKLVSSMTARPGSSAGLRDSQNGLRQNRLTGNWFETQPGIPAEFRGPDIDK